MNQLEAPPKWLSGGSGTGPVVVSTRVRLARNLHGARFISVATDEERQLTMSRIKAAVSESPSTSYLEAIETSTLEKHERLTLHERHLIPRNVADEEKSSALFLSPDEGDSVVVNEEDHVRIQALRPKLAVEEAWDAVDAIDDILDSAVEFAFNPVLGYLTACPTNVGTGLRVSVMMHLPALVLTGRLSNVTAAVIQGGFTVRGMHGEGSEPAGYLFQVSNQRTLGRSEGQIVAEFSELVRQIEGYEVRSRRKIMTRDKTMLEDRVFRGQAILEVSQVMGSKEAITLLSTVRLGVGTGTLSKPETPDSVPSLTQLDHLMMLIQPGHMQTLYGGELGEAERDRRRPELIRKYLFS